MANVKGDLTVRPDNIIITELTQIAGYELNSEKLKYKFEEPQKCSIENDEQVTDLTGKGGRLIGTLKTGKSAKITGTNGIVSFAAMGSQLGSEYRIGNNVDDEVNTIVVTELLKVKEGIEPADEGKKFVTLSHAPFGLVGSVAVTYDNNSFDALEASEYTHTAGAIEIEFTSEKIKAEKPGEYYKVTVSYLREVDSGVMVNDSAKYSGTDRWVIDALGQDPCGNEYWVQIDVPKVSVSGTFSLEMGDAQTVQNFEGRALTSGCGANSELYTIKVIGMEPEE